MVGRENFHEDEITGINITPLVDVMLVLLVIFMVTTSYIDNRAIKISLPAAATAERATTTPTVFAITAAAEIYLNGERLPAEQLSAAITRTVARGDTVTVKADHRTPHGTVIKLMDKLRAGGITAFAISVGDVAQE